MNYNFQGFYVYRAAHTVTYCAAYTVTYRAAHTVTYHAAHTMTYLYVYRAAHAVTCPLLLEITKFTLSHFTTQSL